MAVRDSSNLYLPSCEHHFLQALHFLLFTRVVSGHGMLYLFNLASFNGMACWLAEPSSWHYLIQL